MVIWTPPPKPRILEKGVLIFIFVTYLISMYLVLMFVEHRSSGVKLRAAFGSKEKVKLAVEKGARATLQPFVTK